MFASSSNSSDSWAKYRIKNYCKKERKKKEADGGRNGLIPLFNRLEIIPRNSDISMKLSPVVLSGAVTLRPLVMKLMMMQMMMIVKRDLSNLFINLSIIAE